MSDPFETLKDKYMRPAPGFLFHPQVSSDLHRKWGHFRTFRGGAHVVETKLCNLTGVTVHFYLLVSFYLVFKYIICRNEGNLWYVAST